MKKIINNKGITLMALVVTIIVMMIIASIAVYEGKEIVDRSKVQTLQTNMLTIQAKAKAYAEEIEAKVWALSNENNKKEDKRKMEFALKGFTNPTSNNGKIEYTINDTALKTMGLDDSKASDYTVIFSSDYSDIDIRYNPGIKYEKKIYNLLSDLQEGLSSEE